MGEDIVRGPYERAVRYNAGRSSEDWVKKLKKKGVEMRAKIFSHPAYNIVGDL